MGGGEGEGSSFWTGTSSKICWLPGESEWSVEAKALRKA